MYVWHKTQRIFALVYCSSLNGCFMYAKTFKLLDVFPHEGFRFCFVSFHVVLNH